MQRLLCRRFCSFTWVSSANVRDVLGWSYTFVVEDGGSRSLNTDCHDLVVCQWSLWLLKAQQKGRSWKSALQATRSCCHSVGTSEEKLWMDSIWWEVLWWSRPMALFSVKVCDTLRGSRSILPTTFSPGTKKYCFVLVSGNFGDWSSFYSHLVVHDGQWWCRSSLKYMEVCRRKKTELQHVIIVMIFATAELPSLQCLSNPALILGDKTVAFFKPEVIANVTGIHPTCHRCGRN